jgi:hypothetical protein
METDEPATQDDRATERTGDGLQKSGKRPDDSDAEGGPYGNPEVDEETLRKRQEEAHRQRQEEGDR